MGLVLGLVTIGVWYSTRSPNVVLVPGGASGDSLGLNLVTEPLLLVIPVVFAICYGLTAMLLAARKSTVGGVISWGLPVVLVIPVVLCLLTVPQHYELVPAGETGHYPQTPAAAVAIAIVIIALGVSVVCAVRERRRT
ncbi:hypothetical protein GIY30_11470 [Gordonia sp. HNM0687]|uniref:Uncharacterized protein n=1 Tax=Gordonia mangrovi TaxID=2665643 RepID=A0A6L7GRG3_9ACTN|nr:hypothetical protein [Gordonia mangrovi]MXP21967.1 hypothetical protein [Gordonia mangrovi]UVF76326.1 hypothetical protein NWF22_13090 [Gordonia mangrovi]